MRFFAGLLGFFLLATLSQAHVVQRRINRNTEEILVPVTIIQDGEEIKEPTILQEIEKEAGLKNLQPEVMAENIVAAAVEAEQNLEAVEAVVQAERRIDEAIVEQEINEAIKEEQDKETERENNLQTTEITAVPESVSVQQPIGKIEEATGIKSTAEIVAQSPEQSIIAVVPSENTNNVAQQPEGVERQATQATPTQTTTQQNFVQQLIQNSPLGQFFNQITGQTQVVNSEGDTTPAPALPGLFNPVAAVQNAAQSVVNTTTQAFQGLQQFASNLGNQFQSTLSGLGGQPPAQASGDSTAARPPGPIQQLVNTFIPQPGQPAAPQQGPLQGLLNIFQGNNRPQQPAASSGSATPDGQPAKDPEIQEQQQAATSAEIADQTNNEVRDSGEANDSFEESVKPEELIIVNDDAIQTDNVAEQEITNN